MLNLYLIGCFAWFSVLCVLLGVGIKLYTWNGLLFLYKEDLWLYIGGILLWPFSIFIGLGWIIGLFIKMFLKHAKGCDICSVFIGKFR